MRFLVVTVLYLLHGAVITETLNTTHVLLQYLNICGPEYLHINTVNYPHIAGDLQICPKCSPSQDCFYNNNCCPDMELKFPPSDCLRPIVYSFGDTFHLINKYNIISKCPEGSDSYLLHMCTKSADVQEKLQHPPATSIKHKLSFKNKFCALCNNITDFVYWKVNMSCNTQFSPFTSVSHIALQAIENACTISYLPGHTLSNIVKPCTGSYLIDRCNVTGTWKQFDKEIDTACQSTSNPFPPYKNVFCYICNPPIKSGLHLIDKCNMTNRWLMNNDSLEIACRDAGYSEATFPYKNIYCYLCNVEPSVPTKTYSVEVNPSGSFTYYLFDDADEEDDSYTPTLEYQEGTTSISKQPIQDCKRISKRWAHRFDCSRPVSLSPLVRNNTIFLSQLGVEHCNSTIEQNSYKVCKNTTTECVDILHACERNISEITLQGIEQTLPYSRCSNNVERMDLFENDLPLVINGEQPYWCQTFDCNNYNVMYPLKYLACNCCIKEVDKETIQTSLRPWNIFSLSYYSKDCSSDEVFDAIENKCRKVSCYIGKELRETTCELVLPGSMYSMPVGYTLPLRFTPLIGTDAIISTYLKESIREVFNYSFTLCTFQQNGTKSFYAHIDIYSNEYSSDIEHNLLNMTSHMLDNNSPLLRIIYDSTSLIYVNSSFSEACPQRHRPVLTKLLVCPNILFNENEYTLSVEMQSVDVHKHGEFQFHEFHIDYENNLRLCVQDFNRHVVQSDYFFLYSYIMITCTIVSVVCLSLTMLTYILFSNLRTVPGKNIMNLVLSLFFYHISFLILMVNDSSDTTSCQLTGSLLHFSVLLTLGSFTSCTIHMFKVFGRDKLVSAVEASHVKFVFLVYVLIVYGCSAFVVIINIIITTIVTGNKSVGYGGNGRCFLSFQESFIATVMIPIIITFVVNVTLYSITIQKLMSNKNGSVSCVSTINKKELQIFMKLFVTTGCSWILFILVAFMDTVFVYVIISGLNSLQGLYIFIAYILNERIFQMYKSKFASFGILTVQRRETTTQSLSQRVDGKSSCNRCSGKIENRL